MKILIILIKWEGGVGRVIQNIKPLLEKKKNIIEVISREDDLNCYSLIKSVIPLRKEINKRNYDILYIQDWSCALPLIDKKSLVCFHGEDINKISRFFQTLTGKLKGKRLIVVGDKLKKRFPKSNLIYNGVNFSKFKNLKKIRNKIGWIDKATEEITKEEFLRIAEKYKLKPTIAKDIPPEKMNDWYNSLKVFVSYPTKKAGFNLCWLEAKAAGVPIILGNDRGIGVSKIKKDWKKMSWRNHIEKLIKVFENK